MRAPDSGTDARQSLDVVVVDDNAEAVEELVEYLARANLVCKSALNAWVALELFASGWRPSVVVADLRMPELDGMEFAAKLQQLDEAERPEIIFVSGHAGFDDAVAAIRLGARDMLMKPIDGVRLVKAVKSAQLARQMRRRSEAALGDERTVVAAEDAASRRQALDDLRAIRRDRETRRQREEETRAAPPAVPGEGVDPRRQALNDLRAIRRVRGQHFAAELFSDPNWEMLLDLYAGAIEHQDVTVTSLGAASGVPLTTALRRMETLQSHGLIQRLEDKGDRRRTIVKLTDDGLNAVERFFESYLARRQS
ncbi:MAG: response regulator [Reyranellaceae bacterium]